MNLIIDIGNTQTKLAIFNGSELEHTQRTLTLTQSDLKVLLDKFKVTKTILSCVGKKPFNVAASISGTVRFLELSSETPVPITNKYQTKSTLGTDRIAAAVGAATLFPNKDVLAIGCGTAITYDFVNRNGEYLGGAISPGIGLRFRALNQFTANLPLQGIVEKFPILGQSTHESIESGVLNGAIFEIDGYVDRVKQDFSDSEVILTGGDANFFVGKLKSSIFVNPNLVLTGLNSILNYNE